MKKTLSCEACDVVMRIVSELHQCTHMYRSVVEGGYEACISNYGMTTPAEGKDVIVDAALDALNSLIS